LPFRQQELNARADSASASLKSVYRYPAGCGTEALRVVALRLRPFNVLQHTCKTRAGGITLALARRHDTTAAARLFVAATRARAVFTACFKAAVTLLTFTVRTTRGTVVPVAAVAAFDPFAAGATLATAGLFALVCTCGTIRPFLTATLTGFPARTLITAAAFPVITAVALFATFTSLGVARGAGFATGSAGLLTVPAATG
jgi:hypothetical protein